jgi:threonine dehydratase
MKIIIEPSSAMTVAALLGHAALDLQSSAEWRQVVRNVLLRRQQKGDKSTTVRVCVIIGGGNVSFDKVFEWFRDSETLREG